MASTGPADLAVAFRSFARRLNDAMSAPDGDPSAAHSYIDGLTAAINEAAAALKVSPGADLAATGAAIAQRIEATPADEWNNATLDTVRAAALTAGRQLRQIEQAVSQQN